MTKPKRFLITGATSGIGRASAEALARRGHHLLITGRDQVGLDECVRRLLECGAASVAGYQVDLSNPVAVTQLVACLLELPPLDGLVLAAGILEFERRLTSDGVELNYAVNHLSKFVLLDALAERLAAAGARVVLGAPVGVVQATLDDIRGEKSWSLFQGIARSQYANDVLALELARRWGPAGLQILAWNPGPTRGTRFARSLPWWARSLFWLIGLGGRKLAEVGEQGADLVSFDPGATLRWIKGKKYVATPRVSEELPAQLWKMDEELLSSITLKPIS